MTTPTAAAPVGRPSHDAIAAPWRARLGRWWSFCWRFRTLSLSARVFAGAVQPYVLRRRLFGHELAVDVSRSSVQRLLFLEGERYIGERKLVRSLLAPGMRAADVGANIGFYLLLIESAVGPAGQVTCFEPDADNVRELRRNVEANRLANVEVVAAAVGTLDGAVSLRPGINAAVVPQGRGELTVPLVRLDSALAAPVDFLKIDVEGYEGHVLEGARHLLSVQRPNLFLEVHPGFLAPPHTVDGILGLLAEHYPEPELFETAPQDRLGAKLRGRYLGRPVRRVRDVAALLTACRCGLRREPFWVVCRAAGSRA
jgi:FkbM family methyltransferase